MNAQAESYDSAARPPRALEELRDLYTSRALIKQLVSRNLKVRYKRSVLGVVWTLVNPAAMALVLVFVFSTLFKTYTPSYIAFLLPGLILWNFFAQTTSVITVEVAGGVDMWRRVRMPKTALALATTITSLINLAFAALPVAVILAVVHARPGLPMLTIVLTAILMAFFTLGLALAIAAIALYFPDVADLYQLVLPVLMFATPIIYPSSVLPPRLQALERFNPLATFVEAFRRPFAENSGPLTAEYQVMFVAAILMLGGGWWLFTRSADDVPYRS
jgi:ABC-type polysaccharide/polyol phosphate export permease